MKRAFALAALLHATLLLSQDSLGQEKQRPPIPPKDYQNDLVEKVLPGIFPPRDKFLPDEPIDLAKIPRIATPAQAAAKAIEVARANPVDALFWRFVFLRDKNDSVYLDAYFNQIWNQSGLIYSSTKIPLDDQSALAILDFRRIVRKEAKLSYVSGVWERLQEDEPFWLLNGPKVKIAPERRFAKATKQTDLFDGKTKIGILEADQEVEILAEQKLNDVTWFTVSILGKKSVVNSKDVSVRTEKKEKEVEARGLNPSYGADIATLTALTQSNVPIVDASHLVYKGTWNVNGGLYYEFRDIREAPAGSKLTDFQSALITFAGVDPKVVEELGSDMKAMLVRSAVTGKKRAGIIVRGSQVRADLGTSLIAYTLDGADEDRLAIDDPFRSPLDHKFKAIEMFIQTNTSIICLLFDGNGKLQRAAPDNVVSDHSISAPNTRRLNGWISCARCHTGTFSVDGLEFAGLSQGKIEGIDAANKPITVEEAFWKPFPNHVLTILRSGYDIFGDKRDGFPREATVNRIAQLFTGEFTVPLMHARMDMQQWAFQVSRANKAKQPLTANQILHGVVRMADDYLLNLVMPKTACAELGFKAADDAEGVRILRTLMPPLPPDALGIRHEDPNLILLFSGLGVDRIGWNQVYADAANRTIATLTAMSGKKVGDETNEGAVDK